MCFSATASFVAGGTLSTIGVATLKKVKKRYEIPFAAFPLLFAIQQITEGVVWLTFMHNFSFIHTTATYLYAFFAYVLWPIISPISIRLLETDPTRRKILSLFAVFGLSVGLYLLYFIVRSPLTSQVVHESIVYQFSQPQPFVAIAILGYLIAGCFSCFVSSQKIINIFGVVLLGSLIATYQFYSSYVVSIWCFFAALLSGIIYLYFDKKTNGNFFSWKKQINTDLQEGQ